MRLSTCLLWIVSAVKSSRSVLAKSFCKILILFDLILYVPVNNFSVMLRQIFLGWTSTKQKLMCLVQGNNTVMLVSLKPTTPRSQSKKACKDQESIQSNTTLDPGYQWESDKLTVRHHKREPRGQPFPSRWPQGTNKQTRTKAYIANTRGKKH